MNNPTVKVSYIELNALIFGVFSEIHGRIQVYTVYSSGAGLYIAKVLPCKQGCL